MAKKPTPQRPSWDPESIGARLMQARQALGMTQAQMADQAGIARNAYNQWERGVERPSLGLALQLCAIILCILAAAIVLGWGVRRDYDRDDDIDRWL